ncbi:hypothetical protein MTO96_001802 [Rhipicephalus appendiculatus]
MKRLALILVVVLLCSEGYHLQASSVLLATAATVSYMCAKLNLQQGKAQWMNMNDANLLDDSIKLLVLTNNWT